jgi:hypothetical protein
MDISCSLELQQILVSKAQQGLLTNMDSSSFAKDTMASKYDEYHNTQGTVYLWRLTFGLASGLAEYLSQLP